MPLSTSASFAPVNAADSLALLLSLAFVLTAGFSATIGALAWRYRESDGAVPFVVHMAVAAAVAVLCAIDVFVSSADGSFLIQSIKVPLQAYLAVIWLVFVLQFSRRHELVTRRTVAALSVVPLAWSLALWTTPVHDLVYRDVAVTTVNGAAFTIVETGPLAHAISVYAYLLVFVGICLLVRLIAESRYVYRRQAITILVGFVVPIAASVVLVVERNPIPGLDFSPFALVFTGLAILWAFSNYRLFDLSPIARDVLVQETGDGIVVVDRDGDVTDVNLAAGRLVGERPATLIGAPLSSLFASLSVPVPIDGAERRTTETTIRRDGEERHFEVHITPLESGRSRTDGILVVLHDVTERTRRANELERQRAELRRQNDRLDRFASMVSHDLRNPLNVARGYLDLVDERDGDPIEEVDRALERMDRMVTELLALARAGATIDEDSIEPVALDSVVDEAWRTVDTRGVTLERPLDAVVSADRERLRHVFENLFRNAIDHADPTTVRVGYDPGTETLFVEDDGPGIPPERRSSVFDQGVTSAADGSGLGLAIAGAIVEAHGWSLAVAEGRDGGARFELSNVVAFEDPKPGAESAEDSTPRADRRP